ncbi:MAG TPA: carbamoyl phosphate synthase small subunit, partial [Verrucomicrobiales bacterium]|nr:carbamoyl phosphate synthase small subunit [Verrucomicrobiales bacterium]
SNYRADYSLGEYMESNGIPGIQGIDTRALTKKLRVRGAMNGYLTTEEGATADDALAKAKEWPGLVGVDYVK